MSSEISWLDQLIKESDKILMAFSGSTLFLLQNRNLLIWEKLLLLTISSSVACVTNSGLVEYLGIPTGMAGVLTFLTALCTIPLSQLVIMLLKDPSKIKEIIDAIRGSKK